MTSPQHAMWAAVAPAWSAHAAYADTRGAQVAAEMLAFTAPAAGDRPRPHRGAGRGLRHRGLPRRADVLERPGSRRGRDAAGPATRRTARAGGLGPARAQSVARP